MLGRPFANPLALDTFAARLFRMGRVYSEFCRTTRVGCRYHRQSCSSLSAPLKRACQRDDVEHGAIPSILHAIRTFCNATTIDVLDC